MATTADSTKGNYKLQPKLHLFGDLIGIQIYKDAGKILRFPGEHDPTLPDVSIAQYVLDIIKGYGNDEACVITSY